MADDGRAVLSGGVRALGAFSGGLDGIVAATLLVEQGISVELATFSSPFFDDARGRAGASALGLPWRGIDLTERMLLLLGGPPSGFGGNMNPCIDCHAAMFEELGSVMLSEGFDFVFSGEVLGQRPMSQNRQSLARVAKLSGIGGRLLRPLSALALQPTRPEEEGLVDRSGLLGITGRGRGVQMAFASERGLDYPPPAGGCLLTDPGFSLRLRALMSAGLLEAGTARLIGHGRMLGLGGAGFGIVGRHEAENGVVESLAGCRPVLRMASLPGPSAVLVGDPAGLPLLASLVAFYGRAPAGSEVPVEVGGAILPVRPATRETADTLLVCLRQSAT